MFRLTLKLCIIIVLLAIGSILFAQAVTAHSPDLSPNAIANAGFTACMLPCWGGLVPSITHLDEVEDLLVASMPDTLQITSQTYNLASGQQNITNFSIGSSDDALYYGSIAYSLDETISALYIHMDISFAYLLNELGAPVCLVPFQTNKIQGFQLVWQKESSHLASILLDSPSKALTDDASVVTDLRITVDDDPCASPDSRVWRGFAPAWFYSF